MKVIHILANGSVKDDMTDYKIDPDAAREFYNVAVKIIRGGSDESN